MLTSLRNSEDRQVDTQGVWKSFWRFFGALPVVPLQAQLREAAVAQLLHRERPCCKSLMLCEQVPVDKSGSGVGKSTFLSRWDPAQNWGYLLETSRIGKSKLIRAKTCGTHCSGVLGICSDRDIPASCAYG